MEKTIWRLRNKRGFLFILPLFLFFGATSCSNQSIQKDFPNHLICLTEQNKELVIFNSCYMGNLEILINGDTLLMTGQQEDDSFIIKKTDYIKDEIVISTINTLNQKAQTFTCKWMDASEGVLRIKTQFEFGLFDQQFVVMGKMNNFKTIDQPCVECWPQEECDYMDSLERVRNNL